MYEGWCFIDFALRYKDENEKPRLQIMFHEAKDKVSADFHIEWVELDKVYPKLVMFDDCWLAVFKYGQKFTELLASLDCKAISKEELKKELFRIGFTDLINSPHI